jgi:hypothetical protein
MFFYKHLFSERNLVTANKIWKFRIHRCWKSMKIAEKDINLFYVRKTWNAYHFNGELGGQPVGIKNPSALKTSILPTYYYRYAQTLRSIGENDKANTILAII